MKCGDGGCGLHPVQGGGMGMLGAAEGYGNIEISG